MSEWQRRRLDESAEVVMGSSPPGDTYNSTGDGLPFLQGSAEFGTHYPLPVKWCSAPVKVAEPGDLMVSVRAPVGDTNFANARLAIGRGLALVRGGDVASSEYLRLTLQHATEDLLARSGFGMFTSITAKELKAFPIPLPSLAEQRRIVDVMAAVDAQIEALEVEVERSRRLLTPLAQGVFDDLGGETVRLGDVLTIVRGGSPRPIDNYFTTDSDGLNWIKIGDVARGGKYITKTAQKIKPKGLSKTRFVRAGSFLLSNSMSFGRPYILAIDGCIHDGWLSLTDKKNAFSPDFLYYLLRSQSTQEQFEQLAAGSGVRNLNIKSVQGVVVSLPAVAEQLKTGRRLNELTVSADALGDELASSRAFRSTLLSSLLSQNVEIPEPYDDVMAADLEVVS